jgi:hypothetical protein
MPDAIIVEDVTLTRFAHREAVHFLLVMVGYDDFATGTRQVIGEREMEEARSH